MPQDGISSPLGTLSAPHRGEDSQARAFRLSSVDEPGTTDIYASLIEDAKKAPGILFRPDTLEWLVNLPQEECDATCGFSSSRIARVFFFLTSTSVHHAEDDAGDNLQGHAIEWSEIEPWANPVDVALLHGRNRFQA